MIEVVNFLTSLFESGLGYGGVASARSALGHVPWDMFLLFLDTRNWLITH